MLRNGTNKLVLAGLSLAFCILFQLAPAYWPVAGLLISPLSTIPICLISFASQVYGLMTWIASALMMLYVSPQESVIFLCTTGLLGLMIGLTHKHRFLLSAFISSTALFLGINALGYIFHVAAFGDLLSHLSAILSLIVTLIFSTAYSFLWVILCRKIIFRLPIKAGKNK